MSEEKDKEKFKNLMLFSFYGTDEEFVKVAPYILGVTIIVVVLIFIFS